MRIFSFFLLYFSSLQHKIPQLIPLPHMQLIKDIRQVMFDGV